MPALLFAYRPERCPYGHSLAPGMPQKISWLPRICDPAREAADRAAWPCDAMVRDVQCRGPPGHQVLRAAAPSRPEPSAQRLGDTTGRLSASNTTARATAAAAAADRSAVWTVTTLIIPSKVATTRERMRRDASDHD